MFLGINAEPVKWREDGKQFSLVFRGNPLIDLVELPPHMAELNYDNILCGVIRGALFMVHSTHNIYHAFIHCFISLMVHDD
jgi:hypothetical protein